MPYEVYLGSSNVFFRGTRKLEDVRRDTRYVNVLSISFPSVGTVDLRGNDASNKIQAAVNRAPGRVGEFDLTVEVPKQAIGLLLPAIQKVKTPATGTHLPALDLLVFDANQRNSGPFHVRMFDVHIKRNIGRSPVRSGSSSEDYGFVITRIEHVASGG